MKQIFSTIWRYIVLVVSVLMIVTQSNSLIGHLSTPDWYSVLIDVIIIAIFAYILWNRFLKKDKPVIQ